MTSRPQHNFFKSEEYFVIKRALEDFCEIRDEPIGDPLNCLTTNKLVEIKKQIEMILNERIGTKGE